MKTELKLVRLPSVNEQIEHLFAQQRALVTAIREREQKMMKLENALFRNRLAVWCLIVAIVALLAIDGFALWVFNY